jgi:hypothetical protein
MWAKCNSQLYACSSKGSCEDGVLVSKSSCRPNGNTFADLFALLSAPCVLRCQALLQQVTRRQPHGPRSSPLLRAPQQPLQQQHQQHQQQVCTRPPLWPALQQ